MWTCCQVRERARTMRTTINDESDNRCPPTAWSLPLKKGLRHVPMWQLNEDATSVLRRCECGSSPAAEKSHSKGDPFANRPRGRVASVRAASAHSRKARIQEPLAERPQSVALVPRFRGDERTEWSRSKS